MAIAVADPAALISCTAAHVLASVATNDVGHASCSTSPCSSSPSTCCCWSSICCPSRRSTAGACCWASSTRAPRYTLRQFEQYGFLLILLLIVVGAAIHRRHRLAISRTSARFSRALIRAMSWWAGKVRRFARYFTGRVSAAERRARWRTWLTPPQLDAVRRDAPGRPAPRPRRRGRAARRRPRAARPAARRAAARLRQGPQRCTSGTAWAGRWASATALRLSALAVQAAHLPRGVRDVARARRALGRAGRGRGLQRGDGRADPQPGRADRRGAAAGRCCSPTRPTDDCDRTRRRRRDQLRRRPPARGRHARPDSTSSTARWRCCWR